MDFSGVAFITGAGGTGKFSQTAAESGIGAAIAHAFVKASCTKLIITDINPDTLSQTESSLRASTPVDLTILSVAGDISSQAFVASLFNQVSSKFGRIDYAVNSAGIIGDNKPTADSTIEAFDKVNGVNYRGLWMCVREEIKIMKNQELSQEGIRGQRGSIVNIASQLGIVGRPNAAGYCAGKSAVIGLTRCDAVDCSPFRIRVNAVCPGIIETPMNNAGMDLTRSVAVAPMNRMGTVEEVADVVLFLSSDKASFVQGAAWVVDGGYTIN